MQNKNWLYVNTSNSNVKTKKQKRLGFCDLNLLWTLGSTKKISRIFSLSHADNMQD